MKKKIFSVLLVLTVCILALSSAGLAEALTVEPSVSVALRGTPPKKPETYVFVLNADGEYPMPGGTVGGEARIGITGEGSSEFEAICFEKVGVYTYTLTQEKGPDPNCIKYDDTVYTVKVSIVNAAEGGLEKIVVLHKDGTDDKPDSARFCNVYKTVQPEQPKTGVEDKWPWYLAGAALMLVIACMMIGVLRRKDE